MNQGGGPFPCEAVPLTAEQLQLIERNRQAALLRRMQRSRLRLESQLQAATVTNSICDTNNSVDTLNTSLNPPNPPNRPTPINTNQYNIPSATSQKKRDRDNSSLNAFSINSSKRQRTSDVADNFSCSEPQSLTANEPPSNVIKVVDLDTWKQLREELTSMKSSAGIFLSVTWKNESAPGSKFTNYRPCPPKPRCKFSDDQVLADRLLLLQLTVPGFHFVIPLQAYDDTQRATDTEILDFIKELCVSRETKWCFNWQHVYRSFIQHDQSFKNVVPVNIFDPLVAAWVVNPELPCYDFDVLLKEFLQLKTISAHHLFVDTCKCIELAEHLRTVLEANGLWDGFLFEMSVVPVLAKMELNGIGINLEELQRNRQVLKQRQAKLAQEANEVLGKPISLNSPQQVSQAIFQTLKLQPKHTWTGRSGQMSTSSWALQHMKDQHEFIRIVLDHRKVSKMLTGYVDCLSKNAEKLVPSRLNARWLQCGTATGRLSSHNPNIQAQPKYTLEVEGEEEDFDAVDSNGQAINIRNSFQPPRGYSFLAVDYSQIELRVMAHLSDDKKLQQLFHAKSDVHSLVAQKCFKKASLADVTKEERERSKGIVYGIIYGMGPPALSRILKVSLSEAKQFMNSFLDEFKMVKHFIEKTKSDAIAHKEVRTYRGRRRLLPDASNAQTERALQQLRQAINSAVQGSAADVVKMAMLRLDQEFRENEKLAGCKMVGQIHDELLFEIPDSILVDAVKAIVHCMTHCCPDFEVPLGVTLKLGKSWGSAVEFKLEDLVSGAFAPPDSIPSSQVHTDADTARLNGNSISSVENASTLQYTPYDDDMLWDRVNEEEDILLYI